MKRTHHDRHDHPAAQLVSRPTLKRCRWFVEVWRPGSDLSPAQRRPGAARAGSRGACAAAGMRRHAQSARQCTSCRNRSGPARRRRSEYPQHRSRPSPPGRIGRSVQTCPRRLHRGPWRLAERPSRPARQPAASRHGRDELSPASTMQTTSGRPERSPSMPSRGCRMESRNSTDSWDQAVRWSFPWGKVNGSDDALARIGYRWPVR